MRLPRLATPALLAGSVLFALLTLVSPIQRAGQPFSPLDLAPAPWAGPALLAAVALLLAALVWHDGPLRRAVTVAACAFLFGVLGLVAAVPEDGHRPAVALATVALGFAALSLTTQVLQTRSGRASA